MKFLRINVSNSDDEVFQILKRCSFLKENDYAFSEYVYLNPNSNNISEDSLKIRVYKKNGLYSKNVMVIKKSNKMVNALKKDEVFERKLFDSLKDAATYVSQTYVEPYKLIFDFYKEGIQFKNSRADIWFEKVEYVGNSIEFGSEDINYIESIARQFNIVERMCVSLPERIYQIIKQKK